MYKLLLDESGFRPKEEKACVVAGFLGTVDQWEDFEGRWRQALGNIAVFHAEEFWDYREDGHRKDGPYGGWTRDDDINFIRGLLSTTVESKLQKVGLALDLEVFFTLTKDERRWLTCAVQPERDWDNRGKPNDPFYFTFQPPVIYAASAVPQGEKMYPVFDRKRQSTSNKEAPRRQGSSNLRRTTRPTKTVKGA